MAETLSKTKAKPESQDPPSDYQEAHGGIQVRGAFLPVPMDVISLSPDRPFDLFGREVTHDNQARYILFRAGHIPLPDTVLDRLESNGIDFLYIQSDQHREYLRYLESNLRSVIDSENLASRKKAEILYATSVRLLEEIFENPQDLGTLRKTVPLVSHMVRYVLNDNQAFTSLAALSRHDHYTTTHAVNVSGFMCALAVAGGIGDPHALHRIGLGGLLHDLGKICISPRLLNKNGKLSDTEWSAMQSHPTNSLSLASSVLPLHDHAKAILSDHHEKLDGTGYPRKLTSESIHDYARICAICDVFDALTSKRPYRNNLSAAEALELMEKDVGKHFDTHWFETWRNLVIGNLDARNWPPEPIENETPIFTSATSTEEMHDLTPPDRREWPRHEWKIPIRIRESLKTEDTPDESTHLIRTENLSRGGILFRASRDFSPGTSLRIIPPEDTNLGKEIPGKVIRSIPIGADRREFLTGLSFSLDEIQEPAS